MSCRSCKDEHGEYEGNWSDGKPHGQGTYVWKDGHRLADVGGG